jgi:uncharacterized protein (DUF433 family)
MGGYNRLRIIIMTEADLVNCDPEVLGGTPVFIGTRVPVQTLWDYLEAGESLDEFLDHFPSVKREQAVKLLELARRRILERAGSA